MATKPIIAKNTITITNLRLILSNKVLELLFLELNFSDLSFIFLLILSSSSIIAFFEALFFSTILEPHSGQNNSPSSIYFHNLSNNLTFTFSPPILHLERNIFTPTADITPTTIKIND